MDLPDSASSDQGRQVFDYGYSDAIKGRLLVRQKASTFSPVGQGDQEAFQNALVGLFVLKA